MQSRNILFIYFLIKNKLKERERRVSIYALKFRNSVNFYK